MEHLTTGDYVLGMVESMHAKIVTVNRIGLSYDNIEELAELEARLERTMLKWLQNTNTLNVIN